MKGSFFRMNTFVNTFHIAHLSFTHCSHSSYSLHDHQMGLPPYNHTTLSFLVLNTYQEHIISYNNSINKRYGATLEKHETDFKNSFALLRHNSK